MEDIEYVDRIEHEGIIAGINVKTGEIKVRLTTLTIAAVVLRLRCAAFQAKATRSW